MDEERLSGMMRHSLETLSKNLDRLNEELSLTSSVVKRRKLHSYLQEEKVENDDFGKRRKIPKSYQLFTMSQQKDDTPVW